MGIKIFVGPAASGKTHNTREAVKRGAIELHLTRESQREAFKYNLGERDFVIDGGELGIPGFAGAIEVVHVTNEKGN